MGKQLVMVVRLLKAFARKRRIVEGNSNITRFLMTAVLLIRAEASL